MKHHHRLAVLGNPDGWYVRDLRRAASELGHFELDVISFRDLRVESHSSEKIGIYSKSLSNEWERPHPQAVASAESPQVGFAGTLPARAFPDVMRSEGRVPAKAPSSDATRAVAQSELGRLDTQFDTLLVRSMPLGSLEQVIFRMNALHVAQQHGVAVVNPPRTLEIAIDKWLTLDFARQAGLEIPRTICCQDRESAMQAFDQLDGKVVVKPLFGGEGRGLIRIDDREIAWRVFSTLEQLAAVIYIQEFLPHAGFDLRILVIGPKTFCVARYGLENEWRTNLSRGGKAGIYEPTEEQLAIARAAAQAIGGQIVGVDILPAQDGRNVLLEINAVPGWRGTAKTLDIDIARQVLQFIRRGE